MATNYIDLNKLKRFMGYLYKRFLPLSGGTLTGALTINSDIRATGTITGSKVYNAVWNDYAEYFPKEENVITEPGDIISLSKDSETETYTKSSIYNTCIIGVHSNTYGHIIGGENPPDANISFEDYNNTKYIPIALSGRVLCKVTGIIKRGDHIGLSAIEGVGTVVDKSEDYIGIALENINTSEIRKIKIKVR